MRLIDADELKKDLRENRYKFYDSEDAFFNIIDYVDDAPTVDRWHYPSKGELPTEKELVLMKIPECYVLGWYDYGSWFMDDGEITVLECSVSRWQYIIPPKEEATIKCCENCGHYKNNVCERTKTHPNKPKEWTCLDWKEEA